MLAFRPLMATLTKRMRMVHDGGEGILRKNGQLSTFAPVSLRTVQLIKVLLKVSNSHSNFPVFIMKLVCMAAI